MAGACVAFQVGFPNPVTRPSICKHPCNQIMDTQHRCALHYILLLLGLSKHCDVCVGRVATVAHNSDTLFSRPLHHDQYHKENQCCSSYSQVQQPL